MGPNAIDAWPLTQLSMVYEHMLQLVCPHLVVYQKQSYTNK